MEKSVNLKPLTGLFDLFIDLSTIERWNDFPRPIRFSELDKQAHKSIIALILGKIEEHKKNNSNLDWEFLISGLMFESLQRGIFKDIKPDIYNIFLKDKRISFDKKTLEYFSEEKYLTEKDFPLVFKNFTKYIENRNCIEERIIRASHLISTIWEFELICKITPDFINAQIVKEKHNHMLEQYLDLEGVKQFFLSKGLKRSIDLIGQLRFQKRWSQTPRIPATTVLGHMFFVSSLIYFIINLAINTKGIDSNKQKLYKLWKKNINHMFWAGLLHDMLELFTRDIITPVKNLLDDVFKNEENSWKKSLEEYESYKLNEFLETIPDYLEDEIKFLLGRINFKIPKREGTDKYDKEFSMRVLKNVKNKFTAILISEEKKLISYLDDENSYVIDGRLIKFSDLLSALLEASYSVFNFGIKSKHLIKGLDNLTKPFVESKTSKSTNKNLKSLSNELNLDLKPMWKDLGVKYKDLEEKLREIRKGFISKTL